MSKKKIRPLYENILVQRIEEDEKTKGGIFKPESAKEKPLEGKVIAVGEGRMLQDGTIAEMRVKVGDTILFGRYTRVDEVELNEQDLILISEQDVLGIVE